MKEKQKKTAWSGSPVMRAIHDRIEGFRQTDLSVLIQGERGSGQRQAASILLRKSRGRDRVLVHIDCSQIARHRLEVVLFGNDNIINQDTGKKQSGVIEDANYGTLLLEEIGFLPMASQVRLLGVLEAGSLRRLGGASEIPIEIRLIATLTLPSRDKRKDGKAAGFGINHDLYSFFNGSVVTLPSMAERNEDFFRLAEKFRNLLPDGMTLKELKKYMVARVEKAAIERELKRNGGNKRKVAKILDIDYSTLFYKIKNYGIASAKTDKTDIPDSKDPINARNLL